MKTLLGKIHWRWLVPLLIFGSFTLPLVRLTFHNDEALAQTFHHLYHDWAVAVHIAILAFPIGIALLPRTEPGQRLSPRRAAYSVWALMLVFALVGNVLGNVAYTSERSVGDVLDGKPTDASLIRQLIAAFGGVLLVAIEAAAGYLLEQSATWFLFGRRDTTDSPIEEPDVAVAQPRTLTVRVSAGPPAGRGQLLSGGQRPALPARAGRTDKALSRGDGQGADRGGRTRKQRTSPVLADGQQASGQPQIVVRPPDGQGALIVPDNITDEHMRTMDAYARRGSVRAAAEWLNEQGIQIGKTRVSELLKEARAADESWFETVIQRIKEEVT